MEKPANPASQMNDSTIGLDAYDGNLQPDNAPANFDQHGVQTSLDKTITPPVKREPGSYELQGDARIASLDSAWKTVPHPVQGYRVQLYLGPLQEARKVRSQLRSQTGLSIYLTSLAPSYRVCLGDFHDKWAAEKERKRWSNQFPMTIVIPMEISIASE